MFTAGKVDKTNKGIVELSEMAKDKFARETDSMIETSGVALATPMGEADGDPNLITAKSTSGEIMVHMVRVVLAASGTDPDLIVTSNDQKMLGTKKVSDTTLHITEVAETTHEDALKRNLGGKWRRGTQITKIGRIIHTVTVTGVGVDLAARNKVFEDRAIEQPQAFKSFSFTVGQLLSNVLSTAESVDTDALLAGLDGSSGGGSVSNEHGDIDQKGIRQRKQEGEREMMKAKFMRSHRHAE